MENIFSRTELLIGKTALERLSKARVAVTGLGGVGSAAAEALARSGVGALLLVDADLVDVTNLNRQLVATVDSTGKAKTMAMAERVAQIAPSCRVETRNIFLTPENIPDLLESPPDYLIDAIDTVSAKVALAETCVRLGIPIISCMGAGNKLDPSRFVVDDLFKTSVCPLCRVMRRELKSRGISSLKVVYSTEEPLPPHPEAEPPMPSGSRRSLPGSIAFVPPVAGMIAAGAVVRDLINPHNN